MKKIRKLLAETISHSVMPPLTSIIILVHNQLEYTRQCLDSIKEHTSGPYELIIVDNGSTDGTAQYLESEVGGRKAEIRIKIIKNKKNLGFAAGNNQGMAKADGDHVVLMNNDVVVTDGWLRKLLACAEQNPRIGIVGPMSNSVSGSQLVEGVSYDTTSLEGLDRFVRDFGEKHSGWMRHSWRVVGFCTLIKRAVIEKIGGLDDRFGLGNFEDDDFCLRAALAGFECWIAEDCFVHHFGGRTFMGEQIDYEKSLHKNWEIFKQKWAIPPDLAYGTPFDMATVLRQRFDPDKHFFPLKAKGHSFSNNMTPQALVEKLIKGEEQFHQGHYQEAEEIFRGVIADHARNTEARNDLACLLWQTGSIEDALKELRKAMEIDPDDRDVIWNFGQILMELGFLKDALEVYEGFVKRHPGDSEFKEAIKKQLKEGQRTSKRENAEAFQK